MFYRTVNYLLVNGHNAFRYIALSCAALVFFVIIQYLVALLWRTYKRHAVGKRAVKRLRNLKRGEPLEPQPALSAEMPLPVGAEVQPTLEHAQPSEPQTAVSPETPPRVSVRVQPTLKREPLEPQPAVSPDTPLPILERASEPQPAVSPETPQPVSVKF